MKAINVTYQSLLEYLNNIMRKLQSQSDLLCNKDIVICLSNDKKLANNAYSYTDSNTIIIGLQYLKKKAKQSEDAVAHTIAHELSHILFREKYAVSGQKEEEIFADNYGLILCHRAGYNITTEIKNNELTADINKDKHPKKQIRQLIMQRTAARLQAPARPITKFKISIPDDNRDFTEYYNEILNQRKKIANPCFLRTDLLLHKINNNNTNNSDNKILFLLSLPHLKKDQKFSILSINFDNCSPENIYKLYQKVQKSHLLSNDSAILMQFRQFFIQNMRNFDDSIPYNEVLSQLDNFFIKQFENIEHIPPSVRQNQAKTFLNIDNRFHSPLYCQKVIKLYVQSILSSLGPDDSSEKYGQTLEKELKTIAKDIHNADVIPLVKEIKKRLKITPANLCILQKFVANNSFEMQQVRAETLITECLLNPQQALQTLQFLTNSTLPPFHFCGIYPPSSKEEYSYIDAATLSDIRNDWSTISPSKRADIFTLLMESVFPNDCNKKLNLFVDKNTENDTLYKTIMETYINTYTPQQQPYVVATLVSRKDINHPFSYEDYFKIMLQNSGINGCKIHDILYDTRLSENIEDIHRNYIPLFEDDNIEFANLHKLGINLQSNSDNNLKRIGQEIISSTTSRLLAKHIERSK